MSIPSLNRRSAARLFGDDTGAATAEYAIAIMRKGSTDRAGK